jgi:hypothetical protein
MATTTKKQQPGYDIVVTTAIELVGVGLLALLAGTNDNLGRIIIIIMAGWMLLWAMAHTGMLTKYFGMSPAFQTIIGG